MFCLNLEVTFSSSFVIRTNELLQCNLFYFLFMEFDLNFSTDKDDVLTGQAARVLSPVCSADVFCSCPESSAIKTLLSIALTPLSEKTLFSSWDYICYDSEDISSCPPAIPIQDL